MATNRGIWFLVVGALLACVASGLWHWRTLYWHKCERWIVRGYHVSFHWENGLRSIEIIDKETGKPEADPKLRAIVSREAASIASQLIDWSQLKKADGEFYLSLQGCEQPYLVSWNEPNIPDLAGFMAAAGSQDIETIQESLAKGINVNARELGTGRTALIWAAWGTLKGMSQSYLAKFRHPPDQRAVEILLAAGADPNAKDVEGATALMRADASQVRVLLRYGADVNASDNEGRTALMDAVILDETEKSRTLIKAHADVNIADKKGWTALMYAASEGNLEATKLLLGAGADPSAKNINGETALSIARKTGKLSPALEKLVEFFSKEQQHRTNN